MSSNSTIIMSQQTHPGDSTIQTVTGDKYKGDGYYGRADGFHTVQYNLTGFLGTIKMQGTLAIDPASTDWFDITGTDHTHGSSVDGTIFKNFTGNFVWVRALVSNWTDGSVQSVLLNH